MSNETPQPIQQNHYHFLFGPEAYTFAYCALTFGVVSYAVFMRGQSPWWFAYVIFADVMFYAYLSSNREIKA